MNDRRSLDELIDRALDGTASDAELRELERRTIPLLGS